MAKSNVNKLECCVRSQAIRSNALEASSLISLQAREADTDSGTETLLLLFSVVFYFILTWNNARILVLLGVGFLRSYPSCLHGEIK